MSLAIFDLDNTLLAGDSDHSWGEFLVEQNKVDAVAYRRRNDDFFAAYTRGELDILEYLRFAVEPLTKMNAVELSTLHEHFMREKIEPLRLTKAEQLLEQHRRDGDFLLIITATNRFITQPIAAMLGVDDLLATELAVSGNRYTGDIVGEPCYQSGKISHLRRWLKQNKHDLNNSFFYSDSMNDLPLLELVDNPVAVDPDPRLQEEARRRGWPVISLR